jgi:hypothetical protein
MKLEDLSWHDGILDEYRFTAAHAKTPASVRLALSLYPEQVHSSQRRSVVVLCKGVHRVLLTCDVAELQENAQAGNIVDGYRRGRVLQVIVTGGFLEIEASSFLIRTGVREAVLRRRPRAATPARARPESLAKGRRTTG